MIKAIITDLDGVIRYFPGNRNGELESKYNLPPNTIMEKAFKYPDIEEVVVGKISDSQWRENIRQRIDQNFPDIDSKKLISEWTNFSGQLNEDVLGLYKKVKNNMPLVLMTNGTDKVNGDLELLGIKNDFDLIINSSEIGFAKPDFTIFDYALKKLNLNIEEILFIDDSEKIINGAKKHGINCHRYTRFDGLKIFLEKELNITIF